MGDSGHVIVEETNSRGTVVAEAFRCPTKGIGHSGELDDWEYCPYCGAELEREEP